MRGCPASSIISLSIKCFNLSVKINFSKGHGLSDLLWDELTREFQTLFWRSRITNPINPWYLKKAHGSYKTDKWLIFWYYLLLFNMLKIPFYFTKFINRYGLKDPYLSHYLIECLNNLDSSFNDELRMNDEYINKF